ncbi:unnamed protein product [Effrenium voratum]|nr:unnamed protein product [Effrenium voratum]
MLDDDGMGSALRRARFPNSAEAALTFQHSLLATSEKLRLDSQRSRAFVAIEGSVQKTMEKRSQQLAAEKQQESEDASPPPPPPLPPGEPPLTELAQEEEPDAEALDEEGGESHSVFQGGCSLEDERRIEEFSLYDQRTGKMRDTTNDEQVARRKKLVSDWAQIVQSEKEQMKVNPRKAFAVHAPNLEDAFYLIAATYDLDGNGLLDEHETLVVLERCYLMDETLTPTKVKSFFRTWAAGCNKIIGENSSVEDIEDGIGYEEFSALLHWMADMKTTNLYKQGVFAAGDAFKIFHQTEGLVNQRMNFAGFMDAIARVGTMFNKDAKESADMFAAAVGRMDTDEETIRRIKLRIKQAASLHGQNGWRDFFHECDQDQSGYMDVDEFFDMCRHKLHMEDRKSHLQLLFEKLDEDDSGELSIDELIAFIEN